jgi:ATP-dependent DNA helicase RecG
MRTALPIILDTLLRQRAIEGERVEYKAGWNPGKAVSRRYRNRRIGEFLKELDLTEGRSTGVPKILRAMERNGSPPPEFESDEDRTYFLVRLPVRPRVEDAAPLGPRLGDQVRDQVGGQVTERVRRLVGALHAELGREEIQALLELRGRRNFRTHYLAPAIDAGLVEMTDPGSPNSPKQRYRLTDLGRHLRATLASRSAEAAEEDPE